MKETKDLVLPRSPNNRGFQPPSEVIAAAVAAGARSPCQKSRRGAAAFIFTMDGAMRIIATST